MHKLLFLAALAPALASAATIPPNGTGSWEEVSSLTYTANNPGEIVELKRKFPEELKDIVDVNEFASASVIVTDYTWRGETSCAPGDARLRFESRSHGYCRKGGQPCMMTVPPAPEPIDPCAGGLDKALPRN